MTKIAIAINTLSITIVFLFSIILLQQQMVQVQKDVQRIKLLLRRLLPLKKRILREEEKDKILDD
jgi:hypothetical protein